MRLPPLANGLGWPSVHALRTAGWLAAYVLLALVLVELWCALATGFDVYRPLDLELATAGGLIGLVLLGCVITRQLCAAATHWQEQGRGLSNSITLLGLLLGASAVFAAAPTQLPAYSVAALGVFVVLLRSGLARLSMPPVARLVARAVLGGLVLSSTIFWINERTNAGRHEQYAQALATAEDVLAEAEIGQLSRDYDLESERTDAQAYWERSWRDQPYLSSNYFFGFELDSTQGLFGNIGDLRPVSHTYSLEPGHVPTYRISTPHGHTIVLTLNREFRHSAYSAGLAYKGLDRLDRYHYAVVDGGEIALAKASTFDLAIMDIDLPPIGEFGRIQHKGFDGTVYRHDADTYVLIGEPLPETQVWLTLLALCLSLFLPIGVLVEAVKRAHRWREREVSWASLPLQLKLPALLLGSTLVLFLIISSATFLFLAQNNADSIYERQLGLARSVRSDLKDLLKSTNELAPAQLRSLFERRVVDVDVYSELGGLLSTSFASRKNALAPPLLSEEVQAAFAKNPWAIIVRREQKGDAEYLRTYFGLPSGKTLNRVVALNTPVQEAGTAQDIPVIMGKLLVVYVGLLVLAWICGMVLIRMLVGPLLVLADRMQSFQLGEAQEPLAWKGDDGMGRLILAYNDMLGKLDSSTKALVQREREGAWQVMAQQIAHEINNTLTPLRLSAEYLSMSLGRIDSHEVEGPRRMAAGMIERIDHLSQVASQFQSFAQLDTPHAASVELAGIVREYVLHKQATLTVRLVFVDNPAVAKDCVLIDVSHFTQVLNNLVSNAVRAVEPQAGGQVALSLKRQDGSLLLEVRDNGPGIPEAMREHLFDPSFSTKTSQTGLGLPISKRILEYYGAQLDYTSRAGLGTSFFITMPLDIEPNRLASKPAALSGHLS